MSKKDEEDYKEATRQEKVSESLTGPAQVKEISQSMIFIEGLLNSSNDSLRRT